MDTSPATRIGTTMLLTAAVIVLLIFIFRGPLWRPNLGGEQAVHEPAAASEETLHRVAPSPLPETRAAGTPSSTATEPARAGANQAAADASRSSIGGQQVGAAAKPSRNEKPAPAATFSEADPWAATQCVHVFNPDLNEPTRWKVENGCDAPVGVDVGDRLLILPAAAQRPVTLDEQTVHAQSVRPTACFVASPRAISLINAPSEERSTSEWSTQLKLARASDGCLSRLKNAIK